MMGSYICISADTLDVPFVTFTSMLINNVSKQYSDVVEDIEEKKITPIFVLHSTKETIKQNQYTAAWSKKLNWVADPKFDLYKAVGAEDSSVRFFIDLRGWYRILFRGEHITGLKQEKEGILQRPMEILLDGKDGRILAIKRAQFLSDRWLPANVLNYEEKILNRLKL